ncbi:MAG: riboflavin synthase [Planctomycetota bacterium]|nr:riboflavin synthase [Planctomycetota bacterium]
MFTGLVEGLAEVKAVLPEGSARRVCVAAGAEPAKSTKIGDSVALKGCCLTLIASDSLGWWFQAGFETLAKTNLGELRPGQFVNWERALPVDGRLGGHFVQGHVDGVGIVDSITHDGEWCTMWFRVPAELSRGMVPKGSIAVDGVSLTLVQVESTRFSVMLIPHTLQATTLGRRQVGDTVNIETDILGKYVLKLVQLPGSAGAENA